MKILKKSPVVDYSKCIGCHSCERKCPGETIRVLPLDGLGKAKTAPCTNACPAHTDVCGYVGLVGDKRFEEAYDLILKTNPFPSVCGRICNHPCEGKCNRGTKDAPIAIRDIKRFVADRAFSDGQPRKVEPLPANGKSVGIVGAGPSGMTCAYFLALLGYEVHVYEEEKVAGGVLYYGIPEYRLPKAILQREIDHIVDAGVQMHFGCSLGKDVTMDALKARHDAIYLATGAKFSKKMGVPGEELTGVVHGLDFLRDVNTGKEVKLGQKLVVVGGGNTAIDVARTAVRLGCEDVTIVYRRNRGDMPAERIEIVEALEEGVKLVPLAAPVEVVGDGSVSGLKCQKMINTGKGADGRGKVETVPDSEFVIACDMVIPAVSQYFDLPFVPKDAFKTTEKGVFETDDVTLMTSQPGIFAGGDMTRGSDFAITAVADGKKVAVSIDQYLGGKGVLWIGDEIQKPRQQHTDALYATKRPREKYISLPERKGTMAESLLGYDEETVVAEAERCLRCESSYKAVLDVDECLDCGLCFDFCPKEAVSFVPRDEEKPLPITIKKENHEKILEMCRNAKLYPTALVCMCFKITVAETCEAILEGYDTVMKLVKRLGMMSGCAKYCATVSAKLLVKNGYDPGEVKYDKFYTDAFMAVRDIPEELYKDYPLFPLAEEKKYFYAEETLHDPANWFDPDTQQLLTVQK